MFVGGVVVEDDVECSSGGHIEGRKQRRRAMTLVIVGERAGAPALEREAWLGAIQGLDLAGALSGVMETGHLGHQPRTPMGAAARGRRRLCRAVYDGFFLGQGNTFRASRPRTMRRKRARGARGPRGTGLTIPHSVALK